MLIRTLLLATLVGALLPPSADAQSPGAGASTEAADRIYAWRDSNGNLVLSDRKLDQPTQVYEVEGAAGYVTTRPVATTGARTRYEDLVQTYSARESLSPDLVRAVIQVESGFNPRARSPKGAMGLMQLMPDTAAGLGVRNPYDPEDNIRGGTRYLRQLLDKYEGDEVLALAAYNAGPGAVDKYDEQVPPYRETRAYVEKVRAKAGVSRRAPPSGAKNVIYKYIQLIDGRAIPKYSSTPPSAGTYEVIYR